MTKLLATLTLVLALIPLAHAQERVGDKLSEAKDDAVTTKREVGRDLRAAGRDAKREGRKVRQAVVTRCADGRHTIKGRRGCVGHGGVHDPK